MKELLINWRASLDNQIGDTEAAIEKKRQENANAVQVRDDLSALIEYVKNNDIPVPVQRALKRCLSWNPFCKGG